MKDLEGTHLSVERLSYVDNDDTKWPNAICIQDVRGYLIALDSNQALQLARKLIKAAMA